MRRAITVTASAGVFLLPLAWAAMSSAAVRAPAAAAVTVSVSTAGSGTVGSGFAGFSYEKSAVGQDLFVTSDTNLVNLFRLLGPSVLRVGGNTVDLTTWNPSGAGGSSTQTAPPDVTKLAAFLQDTGWKVVYGINLKTNTPANAANEAQFAAKALGSSLLAFEIGNEPEFYDSESAYESAFNTYVSAIKAKVPGAVFDGPGAENVASYDEPFVSDEKHNSLSIVSGHMYIGDETTATISGMLASTPGAFASDESALETAKSSNGIPQWRYTEANSYYHGGREGVSNVQAAALWSLAFMHGVAANGGSGVNFHGGLSPQFPLAYSPITFSGLTPNGVQGVYYGEKLWQLAGTGTLHAATVSGGSGVTAWGIGNNVVVDNEGSSAIKVSLTLAASATSAKEYILTAPSLTSTAIKIAGSGVSASGTFTPAPKQVSVSGTHATLRVPAGSAALAVTS